MHPGDLTMIMRNLSTFSLPRYIELRFGMHAQNYCQRKQSEIFAEMLSASC